MRLHDEEIGSLVGLGPQQRVHAALDGLDRDTVVRDAPHGSVFIDSEAQLNAYRTRFHKVEGVALDPERSRDFIHQLTKEL
ncbi:Scr1 family TA system antitoxin-like transcriptional regulator [Streptomyces sp. NY05-11A]|uniref:Scr1 family TA system antitoxin-like transcriptional regulator n=1 Tax=Streptomyces soliscabiei TaxID=588897 RepID=UPI0029AE3DBF|nr:Scr1 family TA system antitoxin-like transcriptional regulator [Streptomyces sp. NY05-11A]MDX2682256.1 Scr1 family TA system antitoxin-like transcriptional regulator [Streptomyces sp. NY05-11A]